MYLNWFVIKRRLIQKCSYVPSTQKQCASRLLVFQQWILIFQYMCLCIYIYIYIYIYIFLFFQISIPMYVKICTNDRRRCINIRNVVSEVRKYICLVLTALHSFTGNDYISAFYGIGKVKLLNILVRYEDYIKTFKAIGDLFTLNAELFPLDAQVVCELFAYLNVPERTKHIIKTSVQKRNHPNHNNCLRCPMLCCVLWRK